VQAAENDQQFCWEQVQNSNGLFRISQLFAPQDYSDRLLPLYAFFSAIERISCVSETDIAVAQIAWWRDQLLGGKKFAGDHPIIRQLRLSGAAARLPDNWLGALLAGVEQRLDPLPPADEAELMGRCAEVYHAQLRLEAALYGDQAPGQESEQAYSAVGGLLQLLREGSRRAADSRLEGYWWVPLEMLARHEITRSDIVQNPNSDAVRQLFLSLGREAGRWRGQALKKIEEAEPVAQAWARHRHLQVQAVLQWRQLERLLRKPQSTHLKEFATYRPGDLFAAWKVARRMARNEADQRLTG
jgi:phytoene/squalene synthetase